MLGNMVYNIDIETCSFSLNYAFIHVFCCVAQYILHVRVGRCQHFAVSHAFALFALTMDYGFSYMKNGSRTLSYRNPDDEHLGPLGTFLFFFWFDYSAFGIIIWAKEIETKIQFVLKRGLKETIQSFTLTDFSLLSILPLQFWIAPSLSRRLALDSRELLLSRKSHKEGYALALFFFTFSSYFNIFDKNWRAGIWTILVTGFSCGLVHHAPLFIFGMRGYSDSSTLLLTLATEWPALYCGVSVAERLGSGILSRRLFQWALLGLLLGTMVPHILQADDVIAAQYLIPYVPGRTMQVSLTLTLTLTTNRTPHRNLTP